jgi:hypothetical protein
MEPLTNATLLSSLLADRDRFVIEIPPVPAPDSIVVSGDIVQGALLGAAGWQRDIAGQYEVAYEFLATLTDRIVAGDRRCVVLIPGNHDVCWNTARSAMRPVPRNQEPGDLPELLFRPTSKHRWSWGSREVFEIKDSDAYRRRLDAYWSFAERFYKGIDLPHRLIRGRGFNLFELASGQIIVAAFESIHGNDCFSFQGALDDGVVAKCSLTIRDTGKPYLLRIATWHHSVQGPPGGMDYMDLQTVHEMIGNGFRLGLHGHQHLADAGAHYIHLPEQQAMAVVSAGSLCAGSRDLPRGVNRQYNVIVIADDFLGARIHVREMSGGYQFGRCTRGPLAVDGYLPVTWERPADAVGRPIDPVATSERNLLLRAEASIRAGDPKAAEQALAAVRTAPGSYARVLRVEAARASQNWNLVARILEQPSTADELVFLVEALIESGQAQAARTALSKDAERLALANHIRSDLESRLAVGHMLARGNV